MFNTQNGVTTQQSRKTFYSKRPFFFQSEDSSTGRIYISDGQDAWTGRPTANSASILWQVASRVLNSRDLDFDRLFGSFIRSASKGHSVELGGTTELEGIRLNVARVRWKDGGEWDLYFASSTGLWYGLRANPEASLMRVTDYHRVGDVMIPHRNASIEVLPDGSTRVHERIYSEVVLNIALSDSLFLPGGQ